MTKRPIKMSCANGSEPLPACLSHQLVLPSNLSRHGHWIGDQGGAVRVIGPILRREGRMLTDWSGLDQFCPVRGGGADKMNAAGLALYLGASPSR